MEDVSNEKEYIQALFQKHQTKQRKKNITWY